VDRVKRGKSSMFNRLARILAVAPVLLLFLPASAKAG
jgi:hypothetical protein